MNGTGVLTVTSATLTIGATGLLVNASGTVNNNGTISLTGNLTGAGSLIQGTSSTLNLGNASAPTITTLTATTNVPNTVAYNGGAQTVGTYSYSSLTLSGSGAKTGNPTSPIQGSFTLAGTATYSFGATMVINADLNVQGGTLTAPAFALTVTGNTSVSGGGIFTITSATGAKAFTGDITISGGTWLNNTATVAVTVGGNITYQSGTFTSGLGVYTLNGTNKQVTGPLTFSAVTVTTGTGLVLSGTNTIGALNITSPATVTNNGTLTISSGVGATAQLAGTGTFINGAGAELDLETNTTAGNFNLTTLTTNTNTTNLVKYTLAGAQTIKVTGVAAYANLTLAGSGAKTPAATAMAVNGTFTIEDPATFTTGAFTHNFYGNVVVNSNQATPILATGSTLNFETPSPTAATTISGSTSSTIALITANFDNVAGMSTSKTITVTTMTVGGGVTFTSNGSITATTTVVSGASTLVNGGTLASTTTTINGAGALTNNATLTGTTFTVNSSAVVTNASSGTVTLSGVVTVNSAASFTNNGALTLSGTLVGAGSFIAGANSTLTLTNAAAPTITAFTVSASGSTVTYGLNGVQGVRSATYNNLTLSAAGGAAIKTAGGSLIVNGTFTMSSTAAFTTGAFDHTLNGSWVNDSTAATPLVATGSTITMGTPSAAAATTLTGAGNSLTFVGLTISNTSSFASSKPITVTGAFTVNNAFTANAAGTIGLSGSATLTVATGATFGNASTLTNSGTGAITVSDGATFTDDLTVNSSSTGAVIVGQSLTTATLTNNGTLTATASLDGTGQFVNAAAGTLNLAGASAPTITTLNLGAVGNTVNYSLGGAQAVRGGTYYNLTLSTSGTKTAAAGITTNGTFTLSGTATFAAAAATHNINGNWVNGATTAVTSSGTFNFNGTSTISGAGTIAFSSANITNGAVVSDLSVNLTTPASASITVASGGKLTLEQGVVVSGAGTFTVVTGGTLAIRHTSGIVSAPTSNGNVQTTTRSFASDATYIYDNVSGSPQASGNGLPATVTNLTINNTSGVTLSSSVTVTGALILAAGTPGATLSIGANTLGINGTLAIGTNAALTGGATSSVSVGGSGSALTLPALTLSNLTVNRAAGVTLGGNATVGGVLTLTSGAITTSTNKVTLGGSGSTARTSGYVNGTFEKTVTAGPNVTVNFETGVTGYAPVTLVFTTVTGTGVLQTKIVAGDHASVGTSTISAPVSVNNYWEVTPVTMTFTGTYAATFGWDSSALDAGVDTAQFFVGALNTGTWSYPTVGTRTSTSIQATGLTTLSSPTAFQVGDPASVTPPAPTPTATPAPTATPSSGGGGGGAVSGGGGGAAPDRTPLGAPSNETGIGPVAVFNLTQTTVAGGSSTTTTITPTEGTITVQVAAGGLPTGTSLSVGSIAFPDTVEQVAPPPAGANVLFGAVVQAIGTNGNVISNGFAAPVTLNLTLNADQVPQNTSTTNLVLAFWAGNEWLSIPATFSTQSNGSIDVAAQVTHFTVFAIVDDPLKGMKAGSTSSATPPAATPTLASWSGNLATSGFSLLVWRGSASTAVDAAITPLQPRPVAVWALVPGTTRFLTYVPGAPSVVNDLASLAAGQVVIIRTGSTTSVPPSTSTPSTPPPTSTAPSSARTYTVTSTDTLSDIGERFGVPFEQIAAANNIAPPYIVRAGQVLTIPGSSTATPIPSTPVTTRYVVVAGDTLTDLAARFGVSIERIAAANNIASSSGVQIGQVLTIPAAGTTSTAPSPSATRTYVVVAGDTLTDIAARFGVSIERVAAANNISTSSGVQIGQVLTIPAS